MKDAITTDRIANSIIQRRKKFDNYILVEGNHDRLFFLKFKNQNTQIELSFGWEKLIQIIKIVKERGYDNIIGIIDKDLREIIPIKIEQAENIISTDYHDINILTLEKSFYTIFQSYHSEEKYDRFLDRTKVECIKEFTYDLIKPLSYLKLLNHRIHLNLAFKGNDKNKKNLDYSKFIDKENYTFISNEKLVETVTNYSRNRTTEKLLPNEEITNLLNKLLINESYKHTLINNGHDFGEVISLGLKKCLGSIDMDSETFLRENILNYDSNDFKQTELFKEISNLEEKQGTKYLKV